MSDVVQFMDDSKRAPSVEMIVQYQNTVACNYTSQPEQYTFTQLVLVTQYETE
jgi:hypothetical protein